MTSYPPSTPLKYIQLTETQASAPVAVLITSWLFHVASPKLRVLLNVLFIVLGVSLASLGEIRFVWAGFFFQAGGIFSEAIRLILIQILLSSESGGQNMDPLVSLYYYAPVCTVMNFLVAVSSPISRSIDSPCISILLVFSPSFSKKQFHNFSTLQLLTLPSKNSTNLPRPQPNSLFPSPPSRAPASSPSS